MKTFATIIFLLVAYSKASQEIWGHETLKNAFASCLEHKHYKPEQVSDLWHPRRQVQKDSDAYTFASCLLPKLNIYSQGDKLDLEAFKKLVPALLTKTINFEGGIEPVAKECSGQCFDDLPENESSLEQFLHVRNCCLKLIVGVNGGK